MEKNKIEKEFKVLLSEEKYYLINRFFNCNNIVRQINHYYRDNEFELKRKGISIQFEKRMGIK